VIKVAMLRVDVALRSAGLRSRMLLQVHDELGFELAPGEREQVEELVRRQMGEAYPLSVPLEVSIGVGRDRDEARRRRPPHSRRISVAGNGWPAASSEARLVVTYQQSPCVTRRTGGFPPSPTSP